MLQIGIYDDNELDRASLRECLGSLPNYRRAGDLRFTEYSSAEFFSTPEFDTLE